MRPQQTWFWMNRASFSLTHLDSILHCRSLTETEIPESDERESSVFLPDVAFSVQYRCKPTRIKGFASNLYISTQAVCQRDISYFEARLNQLEIEEIIECKAHKVWRKCSPYPPLRNCFSVFRGGRRSACLLERPRHRLRRLWFRRLFGI